jgi:hypothetical protein
MKTVDAAASAAAHGRAMSCRLLVIFGLGIVCVSAVTVAIVGHWTIAVVVLGVVVAAVLLWGFLFGTGRRSVADVDPTDQDLERAKTTQFYVRDKSRPSGML